MALETRADDLYFEDYRRDAVHKLVSITVSGPTLLNSPDNLIRSHFIMVTS
ncbi:MAG: hypothetical protein ACP5VS_15870 [Desulfomonilaceae bacterium]